MEIAKKKHRVMLQVKTFAQAPSGHKQPTWADISVSWVSIEPVIGDEIREGGRTSGSMTHTIKCRFRADVTPDKRWVYGNRVFNILYAYSPDEARWETVCHCKEEVGLSSVTQYQS